MKYRFLLLCVLLFTIFSVTIPAHNVSADNEEVYAEYIIEEGDFLSVIAGMFNTSVDDILAINPNLDVNFMSIGTHVKIPTLKGTAGIINTRYLNIGDTLASLSILSGMDKDTLAGINELVSPTELYLGSLLTTIANPAAEKIHPAATFYSSSTLLETAAKQGLEPESLIKINRAAGSWDFSDMQTLFAVTDTGRAAGSTVSPLVDTVEISPLPLVQGETHVLHIAAPVGLELSGSIGDQDLQFYKDEGNDWYAMIGIDAMADTGLISLDLRGIAIDGSSFSVSQPVVLQAGIFTNEVVEGVDPATLDPANQAQDTAVVKSLVNSSFTRTWGTMLSYPVDEPCFASAFGSRRSYNDGSFYNYHSGIDYSVCLADNINIYAAADGTVVFAQELPIHGNFTVIDHGWGVYTTYSHQTQQVVKAGDTVKRGQLIGLIGSTGRSVGPHLHFEVIINGVYVNPLTWLSTTFP